MSQDMLAMAEKALNDHLTNLPPGKREAMQKFQNELLAEAKTAPGGLMEVIFRRINHFKMLIAETVDEAHFEAVGQEIKRIAR